MAVQSKRGFTGRHMALTLIAFFAVVVGVNLVMARLAVGTFGGTVVANSYVASQHFNAWLAEGRRQAALGWQVSAARGAAGNLVLTASDRAGQPLDGLTIVAEARHPLGRAEPKRLALLHGGQGRYRSQAVLPAGRWIITFKLSGPDGAYQMENEIR